MQHFITPVGRLKALSNFSYKVCWTRVLKYETYSFTWHHVMVYKQPIKPGTPGRTHRLPQHTTLQTKQSIEPYLFLIRGERSKLFPVSGSVILLSWSSTATLQIQILVYYLVVTNKELLTTLFLMHCLNIFWESCSHLHLMQLHSTAKYKDVFSLTFTDFNGS